MVLLQLLVCSSGAQASSTGSFLHNEPGLAVCKSLAKMSSSADFSWRYKTARIVIGDETSAEEGYLHHAPPPR